MENQMTDTDTAAQDRPIVYIDPDSGLPVYRASALGGCTAALVRARLGITASPPPEFMLDRFQEGHDYEPMILGRLKDKGYELWHDDELKDMYGDLHDGQIEVEIKVGGKAIIRCHPDGIATAMDTKTSRPGVRDYVVEAKFLGEDMARTYFNKGISAFSHYEWQASIESHATGMPVLYVIGVKDVEGKGDDRKLLGLKSVTCKKILSPPISLTEIKAKVLKVEKLAAAGDIPSCDVQQYPCGYYADHDPTDENGVWFKPGSGSVFEMEGSKKQGEGDTTQASTVDRGPEIVAPDNVDVDKLGVLVERLDKIETKKAKRKKQMDRITKSMSTLGEHEVATQAAIKRVLKYGGYKGDFVLPISGKKITRVTKTSGGNRGRISWKSVANDAGINEGDEEAEKHRGKPSAVRSDVEWVYEDTPNGPDIADPFKGLD